MPFVYHLCADDFRGTSLLPLNALRAAYPDVYDRECAKWAGRESVLHGKYRIWALHGVTRSTLPPWTRSI